VPIEGTDGGDSPFFSPDGQWLGFAAHGKLKKVPVRGGQALAVCDAGRLRGAAWAPNDTILFAGLATGLLRVSAAGGTPEIVTTPDTARGETHRWPLILPGGRAALFVVHKGPFGKMSSKSIALLSFATGQWRELVRGGVHPRYAATGHVLFWRPSSLWAQPFDLERLDVAGEAVPILEDVLGVMGPGDAYAEVSADGSLFFVPRDRRVEPTLVWKDRHGHEEPLPTGRRAYNSVLLSPDGRRIASTVGEEEKDLWVYDISRGEWVRLTTSGDVLGDLFAWAPDGDRIAYQAIDEAGFVLSRIASDSSGSVEPLLASPRLVPPTSISPDGKELAFHRFDPSDNWDIWILPLEGERKPRLFLATASSEIEARFSPDGRWLAYSSNETGRQEVYVRAYPGPGRAWRVSADGGGSPIWGRDGRELFYLGLDSDQVLAVGVQTGPAFRAQPPRTLFKGRFEAFAGVSPNGQRFLMLKGPDVEPAPLQIVVIPDWFDELRERLRRPSK
jgi:serine/threonine-protein kinase